MFGEEFQICLQCAVVYHYKPLPTKSPHFLKINQLYIVCGWEKHSAPLAGFA